MYTTQSHLIQQTTERALMLRNLLSTLSYRCWEQGDDYPVDCVEPSALQSLEEVLEAASYQLEDLKTATQIMRNPTNQT